VIDLVIWVSICWQLALTGGQMGEFWCQIVRSSDRLERFWRAAARIHQEAWLFAPPGFLILTVQAWHRNQSWTMLFYAYALYSWWKYRDWPEENHWKRRGKKVRDTVKVSAGRLVVVPAGGGHG
jgi:hypothetical protein